MSVSPEDVAIFQALTTVRSEFAKMNERHPAAKPRLLDEIENLVREERDHDGGRFKPEPPPPPHPSTGLPGR